MGDSKTTGGGKDTKVMSQRNTSDVKVTATKGAGTPVKARVVAGKVVSSKNIGTAIKKGVIGGKVVSSNTSMPHQTITANVVKRIRNIKGDHWVYVIPREGKWVVRKNGAERVSGIYDSKSKAMVFAKHTMRVSHINRIIVYDSTGQISKVLTQ